VLLIVTNREDRTADWLIVELHRRDAPFVRFNTEDYPGSTALRWSPHASVLKLRAHDVALDEVTSVWYRRPVPPPPDLTIDTARARWAQTEAREALEGVWRTLDARWVNHPDRNIAASSKPAQLSAAERLGFRVPETLMTNDADAARRFVERQPSGAVVKPLLSGRLTVDGEEKLFFTTRLMPGQQVPWDRLGREPYLFQAFVDKRADIRVTVIGDQAHAVAIDSQQHPDTRTDFRRTDPTRLPHQPIELPADVRDRCVELVHSFGCLFGAIDLAETADGYWFFENNPSGQWAWIEQITGLPLRRRLADLLTAPR
jgi:glutathione synthase/RimK-type ligase-like ATP-grasp enzyme